MAERMILRERERAGEEKKRIAVRVLLPGSRETPAPGGHGQEIG